MNNNKYDILICNNDEMSLPVHVCNDLQEASEWLGCSVRTLYNTKHLKGMMQYDNYIIELVKREV